MRTITILALHNASLASIADSYTLFSKVNEFLRETGETDLFNIQLAGLTREPIHQNNLFALFPQITISEIDKTDLVIIPALTGEMMTSNYPNREFGGWIASQYRKGASVAGLSTGAFLLAYSGLLKNKQCTTHWAYSNEFRYFYPLTTLVDDKIITDQNGLYTSGGSTAYWNLLLHLTEKLTNRNIAIRIAKYFVIDLNKSLQSPFIVFQGLKDHSDQMVLDIQEYLEQHYADKFNVDELAARSNCSRRTFERRFSKATRHTLTEYIQKVKMEAAKKQLESSNSSVNEIMLDTGYADIHSFRKVFRKVTGMTPADYRKRYNS
ncbi:MAG: helix-turn-helix domain-containing protein [Chitinophagaceae bacterium]|nr:helix-turn-helix domain-containing protein [Chitinophagaceae bacterium]